MPLAERVTVARRFQRAIRIDTDVDDPLALEGFVCTQSSASVLQTMAQHLSEAGHSAFHLDRTLRQWEVQPSGGAFRPGRPGPRCKRRGSVNRRRRDSHQSLGGHASQERWLAHPSDSGPPRPPRAAGGGGHTSQKLGRPRRNTWSESKPWTPSSGSHRGTRTPPAASWCSSTKWGKSLRPQHVTAPTSTSFQQLAEMASRSDGRTGCSGRSPPGL